MALLGVIFLECYTNSYMESPSFKSFPDVSETNGTAGVNFNGDAAREREELIKATHQTPAEQDATLRQEVLDAQRPLEERRDQFPFELA
jgi:hypothetical protein